jgi:uncharacterized surface anchored protein
MAERRVKEKPAVVAAGEETYIEFKVHGLGSLEGTVENEYTDALLKGVRITLLDSDGRTAGEDTTGDDGFYRFKHVRAGAYTVRLNLPKGYRSNDQTEKTAQVDTGDVARVDFLIHRHGSIRGRVINEQTNEPLTSTEVELVDSGGNVVRTATTDAEGNYEFRELEVDKYTVRLAVPDNYEASDEDSEEPATLTEAGPGRADEFEEEDLESEEEEPVPGSRD